MEAGFACGSMVLFFFFTQLFAHCAKSCVKKDAFFHPAGSGTGFWVRHRTECSSSRELHLPQSGSDHLIKRPGCMATA